MSFALHRPRLTNIAQFCLNPTVLKERKFSIELAFVNSWVWRCHTRCEGVRWGLGWGERGGLFVGNIGGVIGGVKM